MGGPRLPSGGPLLDHLPPYQLAGCGGGEGVTWLDEEDGHGVPARNKYGRSKQEAEKLCREFGQDVARLTVLRLPRCFPEDLLQPSSLSLANVKANELLGRRAALVNVVSAILLAAGRDTAGLLLLTVCAPWPWPGRGGRDCATGEQLEQLMPRLA